MEQQQSGPQNESPYFGIFLALLMRGLCSTVEVFLHKSDSFGERYSGMQVGVGFLLILFYPAFFWHGYDLNGLFILLLLYVCMLMWIRLKTFLRVRRGESQPHTLYAGTPRIMRFAWRFKEETVKCTIEPILTIFFGLFIAEFLDEPLGAFLMIAGSALFATTNLAAGDERRKVMRMHDSFIEQQSVIDGYKKSRK